MRCSPNNLWRAASIWGALVLAALPATAQQIPPRATGAPRSILPSVNQETVGPGGVALEGVEAAALSDQPVVLGPLGPREGGFDLNLWHGTPSTTVAALMSRLPAADGSTTAHDLARRLLLSAASVQAEVRGGAVSGADRRLMAVRLEKLAEHGDLNGAVALASLMSQEQQDPQTAKRMADVFLLGDDYQRACAIAQAQIETNPTPQWLQALAFCRTLTGDHAGAALTVELLRENDTVPPAFYQLLDRVGQPQGGQKIVLDDISPLSPLLLAMSLTANAQLPPGIMTDAAPLLLARLATTPSLPAPDRLSAAWRVARLGGFEPMRLRQLYAALPFSDRERRAAAVVAPSLSEAGAMALFVQALAGTQDPAEQARLVQAAARYGRDAGALPLLAALTADLLAALPVTADTMAAAPDMVRLLLLVGDPASARRWYEAVRAEAGAQASDTPQDEAGFVTGMPEATLAEPMAVAPAGDPEAVAMMIDLWPLMLITAGQQDLPPELALTPQVLELWWQHQQSLPPAARTRRAALLLTLAEALDMTPPQDAWAWIGNAPDAMTGTMPSEDMWPEFTDAAAQGRVGEMVLMTLVVMGPDGPSGVSPVFLAAAVRGFLAAGLERDARRLAAEAMIGQGF